MDIRIQCLYVDAAEPKKVASFWEAALGCRLTFDEDDQVCIEPPEGSPEDGVPTWRLRCVSTCSTTSTPTVCQV